MAKEICQDCGRIFEGGPHAFLCPECRKKRVEAGKKKAGLRKAEHQTNVTEAAG